MNLDQRLLHQLCRVRVQLAAAISLGLLAGVLLVGQAYLLSQTVSRVFLDGQNLWDIRNLLAGLVVIAVIRAAALWVSEIASHHTAGRIKADLRERLFAHLVELGPAYARGERSGELASTTTEGIEALDAYFSQYIPQLALSALVPLIMLIIVFPLDVLSGGVLLLTAPMIPFFMVLIGSLASAQARKQWTHLSRLSAHFLDVLQGLTTLKIFGRSREQAREIARISEQFRDATMSVLRIAFLSALALEMLATISMAIIAVEIGLRLLYGRMAFDEAFFILILAPEYYAPLRALGARFHAGTAGTASAQRIFEVLSYQRSAISGQHPVDNTIFPAVIEFDTVSYTYADNERAALDGVSFTIQPGQKIALVGRSGAGKSTVAQLLLRFIEPTAGRIAVDGRDLISLPPDVWRERIAWVPQMPYLFAASVADNIRLARPDAPLDDVIHAAQQAHADDFIRALPEGYDTPIGERGARLSGGQAQRIALARAFLKDAPLLILDEATSNLDPETEADIQAAIRALMRDRTVLIIAHHLGTVMDADQIVVLDQGRVAEVGTHQELSARAGTYRRLVTVHGP